MSIYNVGDANARHYLSTKSYGHEQGLSCVFRQPNAKSHCSQLHGYALSFKFSFACSELDGNGWVVDFGSLKPLKQALHDTFDHTVCVDQHDHALKRVLYPLQSLNLCTIKILPAVGCEGFAAFAHRLANDLVCDAVCNAGRGVLCVSVICAEHGANSAVYTPYR